MLATASITGAPAFAEDIAKLEGPAIVKVADVSVGLNGLVCDFCSIALNKTFKKNDKVAATYVDLDTKTLSIVMKDGETLSDEDIVKMVKRAGYSVTVVTRKDGAG